MAEEEGTVRLNLRLPASLHRRLQERARENRRSLNSEILTALSVGLTAEDGQQRLLGIDDALQEARRLHMLQEKRLMELEEIVRRAQDEEEQG